MLFIEEDTTKMKLIELGKTGAKVSALCLGTMNFGSRENEDVSKQLLNQYYEAGGTFLDTANIYSFWLKGFKGGESESLLGKWIKECGNRLDLFIASKVGLAYQNTKVGLKASQIETECEMSLKRLGIETIDLYYSHVDDRNTPIEETMEAFHRLHEAGKIRFIGASNFMSWRMENAHWASKNNSWIHYCCIQQRYSYIRPTPGGRFTPQLVANEELKDFCNSRGLTLLAYSPLLNGAYTRSERTFPPQYCGADTEERLKVLNTIATELDATVNQVIFAWMIQNNPPIIPLMAVSTSFQMRENLESLNINLSNDQIIRLNEANTEGTAW